MDILNDVFELDTLYKNNLLNKLVNTYILINIPYEKLTDNSSYEPVNYSSYIKIQLIYISENYLILDCEFIISNKDRNFKFEFEYYWNFILNEYKFKNNYYNIDYFTNYIKDSYNNNNNIKLSGKIFNKLIFKNNFPKLGHL